MVFTVINTNMVHASSDNKLSELLYTLESKNFETMVVNLKNIASDDKCKEIRQMVKQSDMVIYMTTLDSEDSLKRLEVFLNHYNDDFHPPIFLIIDSETLLSVESVERYLDSFEEFALKHQSKIVNAKYFKDALEVFKDMEKA